MALIRHLPDKWLGDNWRFCGFHFNLTIFSSEARFARTTSSHVITLATMTTLTDVLTVVTESSLTTRCLTSCTDISIQTRTHPCHGTARFVMGTVTRAGTVETETTRGTWFFTGLPIEASWACAVIISDEIITHSPILAWRGVTFVDFDVTVMSGVPRVTYARVCIDSVDAFTFGAWFDSTFVDVNLAVSSSESWNTRACVIVHSVCACAVILTWGRAAHVDVVLTIPSGKIGRTGTVVVIGEVRAFSFVQTWLVAAHIDVHFTVTARVI